MRQATYTAKLVANGSWRVEVRGDGGRIAFAYGSRKAEAEERARLIASAPELLEALKTAQSWMGLPDDDSHDAAYTKAVEQVATAIHHATGREGKE